MATNYQIRKFRNEIISLANQSDLPVEVKRLCFLEITNILGKISDEQIEREAVQEYKETDRKAKSKERAVENGDTNS